MIHRLGRRERTDRRQHAKCVAGAATFDVKDALVTPAMLVVSNEMAFGISGERGFSHANFGFQVKVNHWEVFHNAI